MSYVIFKTPVLKRVEESTFTIPTGFLYASIVNSGGSGTVRIINVDGEEIHLQPGEAFDFNQCGFPYSQVLVDASVAGGYAQVYYIT